MSGFNASKCAALSFAVPWREMIEDSLGEERGERESNGPRATVIGKNTVII